MFRDWRNSYSRVQAHTMNRQSFRHTIIAYDGDTHTPSKNRKKRRKKTKTELLIKCATYPFMLLLLPPSVGWYSIVCTMGACSNKLAQHLTLDPFVARSSQHRTEQNRKKQRTFHGYMRTLRTPSAKFWERFRLATAAVVWFISSILARCFGQALINGKHFMYTTCCRCNVVVVNVVYVCWCRWLVCVVIHDAWVSFHCRNWTAAAGAGSLRIIEFCIKRTKSASKNTMLLLDGKCLAIAWCSVILFGCVDFGSGNRCSRIPERLKTERTPSTGHFRIRLSETSGRYKPGRQYTSK